MANDPISNRFSKKQKQQKLGDLAKKGRSVDDLDAEEEMIKNTKKVDPIEAAKTAGRNDPCPCGSDKKFKKCCGAK